MEAKKTETDKEENICNIYDFFFENQKTFLDILALFNKRALPNVIILNGDRGIGKKTMAINIAYRIFNKKQGHDESNTDIIRINKMQNLLIIKAEDNLISVEQIKVMKEFVSEKSIHSYFKVIILDALDYMNQNSSNAILKLLEEADRDVFIFMLWHKTREVIDTIRSRAITFDLKTPAFDSFLQIASKNQVLSEVSKEDNELLFNICGSTGSALEFLNSSDISFTKRLLSHLQTGETCLADTNIRSWMKDQKKLQSTRVLKRDLLLILNYCAQLAIKNTKDLKSKREIEYELDLIAQDMNNNNIYLIFFYKFLEKVSKNISL